MAQDVRVFFSKCVTRSLEISFFFFFSEAKYSVLHSDFQDRSYGSLLRYLTQCLQMTFQFSFCESH